MAALISVAHKLNYALLSCKSIPFIIARGHMLAMLSHKFSQQDLAATCITGSERSLLSCPKSDPLIHSEWFFQCHQEFLVYCRVVRVSVVKVAEIELPRWKLYEQIRNSKPQGHIHISPMLQWNLSRIPQKCWQVEMNLYTTLEEPRVLSRALRQMQTEVMLMLHRGKTTLTCTK